MLMVIFFPWTWNFKSKFRIRWTSLDYAGIIATNPKDWKNKCFLSDSDQTGANEPSDADNVSTKSVHLMLAEKSLCMPPNYWSQF